MGLDRDEELHSVTPNVTGDSVDGESAAVSVRPVAVITTSELPMNPVAPPRPSTTPVPSVSSHQQTSTAFNTTPPNSG